MSDVVQKILVVDNKSIARNAAAAVLVDAGYCCIHTQDAPSALSELACGQIGLVVCDVNASGLHGTDFLKQCKAESPEVPVIVVTDDESVESAVKSVQHGAAEYLTKPCSDDILLAAVERHIPNTQAAGCAFVATSPMMVDLLELAQRAAQTDATILVTGDTGTGKEVLSQFVHANSKRSSGPFVAINCAAIPENMIEAILFGYEKGAYTGALQATPGKFELAHGGTLLLDEVTEMSLDLQAKLLRVLQERQVERLGGRKTIDLDIRVIATSNRDMAAAVNQGIFREDLYYRLSVFPVRLPPLSARIDDIIPLVERTLQRLVDQQNIANPGLSKAAKETLRAHPWPGNVRELENVIERALIISGGQQIDASHLVFDVISGDRFEPRNLVSMNAMPPESLRNELKDHEQSLLFDALSNSSNRQQAAEMLGISQRTLRYKLAQLRKAGVALPA